MQQVQDRLDFPIDTPSDNKLKDLFQKEKKDPHQELINLREKLTNLSMRDRSKSHA